MYYMKVVCASLAILAGLTWGTLYSIIAIVAAILLLATMLVISLPTISENLKKKFPDGISVATTGVICMSTLMMFTYVLFG